MTSHADSDVRFELPTPELASFRWEHNEHIHGSLTPLAQDVYELPQRPSTDGLPPNVFVNGYAYARPFSGLEPAMPYNAERVFRWRDTWLPRIAEAARQLEEFNPSSVEPGKWRETIELQSSVFHETFVGLHRDTIVIVLPAAGYFVDRYAELFGEDRREDGMAALQGHPNESLARSEALWELSRIARRDPSVREAVEAGGAPAGGGAVAEEFRDALASLLERWGHVTNMHLEDLPTWAEDPSRPLEMVVAYLDEDDDNGPATHERATVARRERLEAEIAALGEGDDRVAELREALAIASNLVSASEDHNALGDHRLLAASPRALAASWCVPRGGGPARGCRGRLLLPAWRADRAPRGRARPASGLGDREPPRPPAPLACGRAAERARSAGRAGCARRADPWDSCLRRQLSRNGARHRLARRGDAAPAR